MDNASNLVYRGFDGTGAATVLGKAGDPIKALMMRQQGQRAQEAGKQAAKAARDKQMAELSEWAPDARWEPFDNQIRKRSRDLLAWEMDMHEQGADLGGADFLEKQRMFRDEINLLASKSNFLKDQYDEIKEVYSKGDQSKYFDKSYYNQKLNDMFMDENMEAYDIAGIDVDNARAILDDTEGYNVEAISEDFVDGLGERLLDQYDKKATAEGHYFDKKSFKSKLFKYDEYNKRMVDPETGMDQINIIPEVVAAAMKDPLLSKVVKSRQEADPDLTKEEILREILTPYDDTEMKNTPTGVTSKSNFGYNSNRELVDVRYRTLRKAVYDKDPAALANTIQSTNGVSAYFTDERGDIKPFTTTSLYDLMLDKKGAKMPDEIILEIDQGFTKDDNDQKVPMEPKNVKIDLSTKAGREAALFELNTVINEATGKSSDVIGNDDITLKHERYLKKNKIDGGFDKAEDWNDL